MEAKNESKGGSNVTKRVMYILIGLVFVMILVSCVHGVTQITQNYVRTPFVNSIGNLTTAYFTSGIHFLNEVLNITYSNGNIDTIGNISANVVKGNTLTVLGTATATSLSLMTALNDGNVSDTITASNYVRKSTWTDHDNYPSACSAGQYVSGVGDTLTCVADPLDTIAEWQSLCTDCVAAGDVAFNYAASASEGGDATGVTCTDCVAETEIAQNSIDDSEIEDDSLTAASLAANSCGNSEMIDNPTFASIILTGTWTLQTGQKGCLNGAACTQYIYSNGTVTIIT